MLIRCPAVGGRGGGGTPTWLASACVVTLFQLGFVTNPDFSQFDLQRDFVARKGCPGPVP